MTAPTATLAGPETDRAGHGLRRHRDFRLLWIGHAVSSVGSNVTSVALPLVSVAVLNASTFQVAVLAGPPALLIPLTGPGPRLAWLVAGAGAVGLGVAIGNVIKGSFRQIYTPHHLLGRVMVSMQLLNFGAIPLGALLAGALGSAFGPRPALWVMTGWLALTGLSLLAGPIHRSRDLPATPEPIAGGRTAVPR